MPIFSELLSSELFAFFLIFVRFGAAFMAMPGFGEVFISARSRLFIALSISLAATPFLSPHIPSMPDQMGLLFLLVVKEAMAGAFIGTLVRFLTSAVHSAGTILAVQSGLANALFFDVTQSGQTTAVSNLLTFSGLVLMFAADLHLVLIMGVVDSYNLMPVDRGPAIGDMAYIAASYLNEAFAMGIKIASPFIAVSLVSNTGAGVLARLMPNFQVFFVMMGPQIWVTFFMLSITFSTVMLVYLDYLEAGLHSLLVAL